MDKTQPSHGGAMPIPVRASVTIAAAAEVIFPLVADPTRHTRWSKADLDISANGDGSYVSKTRFMGKPVQATLRTVSVRPSTHYVFDAEEPKHTTRHEFVLSPSGPRTIVQRTMLIPDDGNAVQRFMVRALFGPTAIKSDISASLKKLKALVEAG
jgi:uncharacterized protein YndB with AHSA1/START domain